MGLKERTIAVKSVREILAMAVIGFALCLMIYYQARLLAPLQSHSAHTFTAHGRKLYFPSLPSDTGQVSLQKRWAPRVLSNILGTLFTKDCIEDKGLNVVQFSHKSGLYTSAWLGLVYLLYLVTLRRRALIPILGTYCGVAFGYMPGIADRIYPWDMPALFFYTLFVCLLIVGRVKWFLVFLPGAVLFKETACVLVLAYLFVDEPGKKRLIWFVLALVLAGGAKVLVDLSTKSVGGFTLDPTVLWVNVQFILFGKFPHSEWYKYLARINHPLLINAGLLAAFFLYPFQCRHKPMLRTIVLVFVVMALFWAIVFEYRIWFELIPICLFPLYCSKIPSVALGRSSRPGI